MGCLRLLLAVFVVVEHAPLFGTLKLMPGDIAVEIFFMLSGFYMALVLDTKYGARSWTEIRVFYASRFWRLWPTFILTTLAAHAWWLFHYLRLGHEPLSAGPILEWSDPWFAAAVRFSNLVMIGQDVPSWFHVSQAHGVHLTFGPPRTLPDGSLWVGYARRIGQAWSIGTEVWFYFAAPFLMRARTAVLATIAAAGLALRYSMETHGLVAYFFFPAQLPLFLAGAMMYRLRGRTALRHPALAALPMIAITLCTIACIEWSSGAQFRWLVYFLVGTGLPALFLQTKDWRADRSIGELSYPIYIVHLLVLAVLRAAAGRFGIDVTGGVLLAVVIPLAYGLCRFVERPIDAWRQTRFQGSVVQPAAERLAA
jgi:peptidoglycan/LPS O-acetylase OafA/YrhL